MPVYTYKCEDCGESFDLLVFASDKEEDLTCTGCGGRKIARQVTSFSTGGSSGGGDACAPSRGFT